MGILLIGVGGAFGSVIRYSLGKMVSSKTKTIFPLGTFIINITGAFLLGVISNIGIERNFYLLLGDGFLGAYTTFSTFMYEGFNLFHDNRKLNATIYIVSSLILGILGYLLGMEIVLFFKRV